MGMKKCSLPVGLLLLSWLVLQQRFPAAAVSTRIVSHPHPVVLITPLNATGVINCTTQGSTMDWIIDGNSIIHVDESRRLNFHSMQKSNMLLESKLIIPAIEVNNNTLVQCRAIGNVIVDSNQAEFQIQGFLAAPGGFHAAHVTESSILFLWDAPFTLDITHVEPDIDRYSVYIGNVNSGRTAVVNVTQPEFTFRGLPGEVPDPFTLYEFHVSAWNVVGEGDRSGPVQASFRNRVHSTSVSPSNDSPSQSSETETLPQPTVLPATDTPDPDVQETSSVVIITNTPDPNAQETSIIVISISLGSVAGVLLLTVIVILLIILITRHYIHKANHLTDVRMKANPAYEITKIQPSRIKVEQNSAYGVLPPGYQQ